MLKIDTRHIHRKMYRHIHMTQYMHKMYTDIDTHAHKHTQTYRQT